MATFPLAVLRPQAHMASSAAALLRYATAEGEQEQLAAEAVSQALPAARSLPLQAQACQPPRVPESEGETQFEQALQSKSVRASQQSAASHARPGSPIASATIIAPNTMAHASHKMFRSGNSSQPSIRGRCDLVNLTRTSSGSTVSND
jgi:hypothetical protein